jgi:hypothetical protein
MSANPFRPRDQFSTNALPRHLAAREHGAERAAWVDACAACLNELMPRLRAAEREALALSMWDEVGYFDPRIAAELEAESWLTDD